MFTFSLYQYQDLRLEVKKGQFYEYPPWSIALGWLITSLPMACVPIYAIFHLFTKVDGSFTEVRTFLREFNLEFTENSDAGQFRRI